MYKERTIRKKAKEIGLSVKKGFQHCDNNLVRDIYGNRITGYHVEDSTTGEKVWPSCNDIYDHLWSLAEVDKFLRDEYDNWGIPY